MYFPEGATKTTLENFHTKRMQEIANFIDYCLLGHEDSLVLIFVLLRNSYRHDCNSSCTGISETPLVLLLSCMPRFRRK
jgi:hypothetical protein